MSQYLKDIQPIFDIYMYKIDKNDISIYDGDTITVTLDLGFNIKKREKIRFYGINAPELKGIERADGLISKTFLKSLVDDAILKDKNIYIKTIKDSQEKYGRYLGVLFIDNLNVNLKLIEEGLARTFMDE